MTIKQTRYRRIISAPWREYLGSWQGNEPFLQGPGDEYPVHVIDTNVAGKDPDMQIQESPLHELEGGQR